MGSGVWNGGYNIFNWGLGARTRHEYLWWNEKWTCFYDTHHQSSHITPSLTIINTHNNKASFNGNSSIRTWSFIYTNVSDMPITAAVKELFFPQTYRPAVSAAVHLKKSLLFLNMMHFLNASWRFFFFSKTLSRRFFLKVMHSLKSVLSAKSMHSLKSVSARGDPQNHFIFKVQST